MTAHEPNEIIWRKSSYSAGNGDCVEIGWRKSSYSANGSACVEVAAAPAGVLVRDSKDPDGPVLAFGAAPWRNFLTTVTTLGRH